MGRQLSSSEAYEIMKRIEEAGNDRRKLEAIKEILEQYNDDDPAVKELVLKLRRQVNISKKYVSGISMVMCLITLSLFER